MHHQIDTHSGNFPKFFTFPELIQPQLTKSWKRFICNAGSAFVSEQFYPQYIVAGFKIILEPVPDRFFDFKLSDVHGLDPFRSRNDGGAKNQEQWE